VLVVDDVKTNRIYAKHILKKVAAEFLVDEAGSGEEALNKAQLVPYSLIFMDLVMSAGMDGLQTTHSILEIIPDAAIVGMTGHDDAAIHVQCHEAGMKSVICKPFKPADFAKMISQFAASDPSLPHAPVSTGSVSISIDRSMLEDMGDLASELVEEWASNMTAWLGKLRTAILATDVNTIAEVLHSMAGASAQLGAVSIHDAARVLEKQQSPLNNDELTYLQALTTKTIEAFSKT